MAGVMLGPGRGWSHLCHQSTRRDVGVILVPWPSPLNSPSTSFRRSTRVSPWSKREVRDDKWDPGVSDCVVQNGIFLFSEMNEW